MCKVRLVLTWLVFFLVTGCSHTTGQQAVSSPAVSQLPPVDGETIPDVTEGTFRVVALQLTDSQVGNYSAMAQLVAKAKGVGAQLVVLPESSALGWLNPNVFSDAVPIPGTVSNALARMAVSNNVWIAAGISEQGASISGGDNHYAWDSGVVINPSGEIVLHHRKYQVIDNAFASCPADFPNCRYTQGDVADITSINTPFGSISILVCADAYTYDPAALNAVKQLQPDLVIVPWGVGAQTTEQCAESFANATEYAAQAAKYIGSAYVIGANATGTRPYGRLQPGVYCGKSGYGKPDGTIGYQADDSQQMAVFDIPLPN